MLLWLCFLVVVCFATRLSLMTRSVYRDEAWVVTSVLSPTLHGMFYYEKWLQSTPPFFLLLVRASVQLFGNSEIALRLVPWLAGILAILFLTRALILLFPTRLAMLGTSFLLVNYWALKYSQQVKQYSTDLLVSSLFVFLLTGYLMEGQRRRMLWVWLLVGGSTVFLSYTAVFWFPVSLLVVGLTTPEGFVRLNSSSLTDGVERRLAKCGTMLLVYLLCFGLAYRFFIRPNQAESLTQFWMFQFIGSGGLLRSLLHFFQNVCDLMLPQLFTWSRLVSYGCGVLILVGAARALLAQYRGEKEGTTVSLVGVLPVLTAVVVSRFSEYPLLNNPRLIIWMLPICTLLLIYSVQPLWNWVTVKAGVRVSRLFTATVISAMCLVAVWLNFVVVREGRSNPLDDFRSGVIYLKNHASPDDHIFVYALGAEELEYYSQRFHWHPNSVYVGDTNLGCCVPGAPQVFGDNFRRAGLAKDVHIFLQGAHGDRAWLLLQSGRHQQLITELARSESQAARCLDKATSRFESTLLMAVDCSSSAAQSGLR